MFAVVPGPSFWQQGCPIEEQSGLMSMNPLQVSQGADWQKSSTRPPRYPEEFSEFARWRYEEPELDSHRFGLTVSDIDQVFFHDDEDIKEAYILLLEVKTRGKTEMEVHEENIYTLLDAALRLASSKAVSTHLWGREEQRRIRYMGWHLLVLSATRPDNSEWMLWDSKHIDKDQLVRMLRFDLDPNTLQPRVLSGETEAEVTKKVTAPTKNQPLLLQKNAGAGRPTYPCPICGSTDWWWRQNNWAPKGEWLCARCHPNPNKEAEMPTNLPNEVTREVSTNATAHPPYRLADSTIVPGVTTVLEVLDRGEGMQYWAWDLGRQGLDYREVRDSAGRVGTITHHLIASHLRGEAADYQPLTCLPDEADRAEKCFLKYLAWEKENPLSPVIIETPFVSEEFRYGGTPDLLAEMGNEFILLDFKTGGGIYDNYFCQLAAYRQLLSEQGWPVAGARVVRISPDDSEVEVAIALDLDREWQIFQHALGIYMLRGGGQWQQ